MMKKILRYLSKEFVLFIIGGLIYVGIEILARGFSHWSMFILGGICFVIVGLLNEFYEWDLLFQYQCLIGSLVITTLEFITGCIVNIKLGWNVWDYSDRLFNLNGQICLRNSIYWIFLSGIAILLDDFIRWKVFNEEKPRYIFKKKK